MWLNKEFQNNSIEEFKYHSISSSVKENLEHSFILKIKTEGLSRTVAFLINQQWGKKLRYSPVEHYPVPAGRPSLHQPAPAVPAAGGRLAVAGQLHPALGAAAEQLRAPPELHLRAARRDHARQVAHGVVQVGQPPPAGQCDLTRLEYERRL